MREIMMERGWEGGGEGGREDFPAAREVSLVPGFGPFFLMLRESCVKKKKKELERDVFLIFSPLQSVLLKRKKKKERKRVVLYLNKSFCWSESPWGWTEARALH